MKALSMRDRSCSFLSTSVRSPAHRRGGFTLIELLLVMIILVVLASIAVPIYLGRAKQAKVDAAKVEIANIKDAIKLYDADNGDLPPSLDALVIQPDGASNWHQYLEKVPLDPWHNPYNYKAPGTHNTAYDVWSNGPDGQEGTADDINSWDF